MAVAGGSTAAIAAAQHASSYRIKFQRREFLRLVEIVKPGIIYHRRRMHLFAYARANPTVAVSFNETDDGRIDSLTLHLPDGTTYTRKRIGDNN